jgi:nitrous oxide reductase
VLQLIGSNNRSKNIVKRIDRLEELVKKGKFKKIHDSALKLKKVITHKKNKALSDTEKTQIIDMIDVFLAQFE